eukprot:CAMPEP_0184415900 /NCGR_PEP_ID=MMETSP0738-20130409/9077_2 /TAXON_ID=385413 /ORGANISM="Thalassiosira miniscula, Strain CCMP1093" /LENGTH=286 /DNA_ID=CAMNT_0026775215 /DNA_START=684 /DNA_END=1542 /DNA_ORIENTATION=-
MFSIEHEFDATIVTLVDEGTAPLGEDVIIHMFDDCVTIEQYDPRTDTVQKITLSNTQVQDLTAALDLPEGVYMLKRPSEKPLAGQTRFGSASSHKPVSAREIYCQLKALGDSNVLTGVACDLHLLPHLHRVTAQYFGERLHMRTGFFFDEKCFWHAGGNYALTLPVGDLVQPLAAGGLPESPETKRRLKNLMDVTGLTNELDVRSATQATDAMLKRVHPAEFLTKFKEVSDAGGGEIGLRTPFGKGGYEIAALSAGIATEALRAVTSGDLQNAYALSRPPGHHCLP